MHSTGMKISAPWASRSTSMASGDAPMGGRQASCCCERPRVTEGGSLATSTMMRLHSRSLTATRSLTMLMELR